MSPLSWEKRGCKHTLFVYEFINRIHSMCYLFMGKPLVSQHSKDEYEFTKIKAFPAAAIH